MARDWRLDEVAHSGAEHLDPTYVGAYDAKSRTDWSGDVGELLALGIGRDSTVVDLGAGTGTFALAIKPHVQRVVAVDISSAMVELMRTRGLEAVQAGFLSYEHDGDPPDAVVSRHALHHLPDFWKAIALQRIATLLRPGGIFFLQDIVYAFEPCEAESAIGAWFEGATDDPARGWTAQQLAEHVRDEHSTFTWLLEPMLDHAGFDIRERWSNPGGTYAAYHCIRR